MNEIRILIDNSSVLEELSYLKRIQTMQPKVSWFKRLYRRIFG